MLSNKAIIKNMRLMLQVIISIFFLQIVLLGSLRLEDLEVLWNMSKIIFGIGCIILSVGSFSNKQNNKVSFMAIGYMICTILLVLDMSLKHRFGMGPFMMNKHNQTMLIINLIEVIYITVATWHVNKDTNIINCGLWSILLLMVSVLCILKIDLSKIVGDHFFEDISLIHIVMILYISINLILYFKKKYPLKKKRDYYIISILGVQAIYQGISLWYTYAQLMWIYHLAGLMNVMNYIVVFSLIGYQTEQDVWWYEECHLNEQKMQLKESEEEKRLLVFFSNALKEYVTEMREAKILLEEKIKTSKLINTLKYADMIEKNCYRLMKLSTNIMDLNKIDIGTMTPQFRLTNIAYLIETIIESVTPYVETMGIQVELIKSNEGIYSCVDCDAIERIMLNLMSNAIKYNKKDGKISIYINKKGDWVYICVKDTGVGIPQDKIESVFKRFERVDNKLVRSKEGSGLGLCIVKSLVDLHKGNVSLFSKDQWGTSVSISLPICYDDNKEEVEGTTSNTESLKYNIEVEFSDIYM